MDKLVAVMVVLYIQQGILIFCLKKLARAWALMAIQAFLQRKSHPEFTSSSHYQFSYPHLVQWQLNRNVIGTNYSPELN